MPLRRWSDATTLFQQHRFAADLPGYPVRLNAAVPGSASFHATAAARYVAMLAAPSSQSSHSPIRMAQHLQLMNRTFCFAVAALVASPVQCAESYLGTVISVIDGDTFRIKTETQNVKIRLCGVDSPERGQHGYRAATDVLADMIRGNQIHCLQVGLDTPCDGRSKPTNRDRVVAQCFVGDKDIAAEMVRLRQACDWPHFSGGHYRLDEKTCVNPRQPKR